MKYTHWNEDLGKFTVPCLYKADGEQISFKVYQEPGERLEHNDKILLTPPIPHVFGEVIDKLAELENLMENKNPDDLVEVVRCKDCKYYEQDPYNPEPDMMCRHWCDWLPTDPDDYCSYGERKV